MNLYIVGLSNNSLQSREKEKEIRSNVGKIFFPFFSWGISNLGREKEERISNTSSAVNVSRRD